MMPLSSYETSLTFSRRARRAAVRLLAGAVAVSLTAACDDPAPVDDPMVDAAIPEPDAVPESPDAAPEPIVEAEVIVEFDPSRMELPEGLALRDGDAFVGLAFTGEVLRVDLETGERASFGQVTMPPPAGDQPGGTLTGLVLDDAGNLYATLDVAVPSDIPEDPQSGIYRLGPDGGAAELFASHPDMQFPNGMYVDGNRLLVTDSKAGAVFAVALADGAVTQWSQHEHLLPLDGNCGPAGIRLGANGIARLGDDIYVANTDRAQIVKIPVTSSGTAGAPEIFLGPDCARLFGLDDLRATPAGDLVYAVNYGNRVDLVGKDGATRTLIEGEPLDGPASLEVLDDPLRIVITNSAFGSFFTNQSPSPTLMTLTLE
jgi:hypothetical protein